MHMKRWKIKRIMKRKGKENASSQEENVQALPKEIRNDKQGWRYEMNIN